MDNGVNIVTPCTLCLGISEKCIECNGTGWNYLKESDFESKSFGICKTIIVVKTDAYNKGEDDYPVWEMPLISKIIQYDQVVKYALILEVAYRGLIEDDIDVFMVMTDYSKKYIT